MTAAGKDDRLYLVHIVEALRKILRYTRGGRDAFLADEMVQDAVYRNFLVIGEAAKRISAATSAIDPRIPCRGMTGVWHRRPGASRSKWRNRFAFRQGFAGSSPLGGCQQGDPPPPRRVPRLGRVAIATDADRGL